MRKLIKLIALTLCVCILLSPLALLTNPVSATTDPKEEYEKKLKAAQDLKKETEQKKAETEKMLAEMKERKSDMEAYIEELDLQMNEISLRIFELGNEIDAKEKELEQTEAELEAAQKQESDQYDTMKRRIAYIYENGESGIEDILLNATSISDVLNQMEYANSIAKYDDSLLERYQKAKENVENHKALVEASLEELNALKEAAEQEQGTVNELMAIKSAEIEKLCEEIGLEDEYLFNYIEEISKQEKSIEEIKAAEQKRIEEEERKRKEEEERIRREEEAKRKAAEEARKQAENNPPKSTNGYDADAINHVTLTDETNIYKMTWPLPGDHRTYSKFGPRKAPMAGASTYHKGWDIGGEYGAPIVSVLAGKVIAVSYNSSAGNFVKVEHQSGFVSVYCHCSKTLVNEGQYVQQGQKIALVGSTGVSTSPHLHFGITINGTYVDPDPYIGYLE